MSRKPRLLALIVLLALAAVWVVISARRTPTRLTPAPLPSPSAPHSSVRQLEATLTRVLFPRDLEIVESTPILSGEGDGVIARHRVVIRNKGKVSYRNVSLEFSYLGRRGRVLATRTHLVTGPLPAGEAVTTLEMRGLPANVTASKTKLMHADLVPQSTK
jgi:hypothetical protein